MNEFIKGLTLPVTLSVIGAIFVLLGIVGNVELRGTVVKLSRGRQKGIIVFGIILVLIGVSVYLVPGAKPTPGVSTQPPTSATTPVTAVITDTPTSTTPSLIATPTPGSFRFEGPVCKYTSDFHDLLGDRVFLRNAEFSKLGVPVGTIVTIAVIGGAPDSYVPGLILDNDTNMSVCAVRLRETTRLALNLEVDLAIVDISQRPVRQFEIIVERCQCCDSSQR